VIDGLALLGAGVLGLFVGLAAGLAFRLSEREQRGVPAPEPAELAEDVTALLAVLPFGAVVTTPDLRVLRASAAARAHHLIRGDRVVQPVARGLLADAAADGATHVVDHTTTSVTDLDERYDVVFDTVGNLTIRTGRPLLRDGGRLLLAVASLGDMARARGDVRAGTSPERAETFARLLSLVAAGDVEVVVESTFALDDIVAAHRVVDSGHKVGNVLVHP